MMPDKNQLQEEHTVSERFDFPEPLIRVTGGNGGEAILILGSEKTGLYDCGMACFSDRTIENIKSVLSKDNRTLDYVFMSHTHYDHIGALPYIIKEWPDVKVCGSRKAVQVFASEGARKTMERLGNNARELFGTDVEITTEGLRIDVIMEDGESISLGRETMTAYVTKGHTDCSMSYLLNPQGILFASETTGVNTGPGTMYPSILKSYEDGHDSAQKLAKLDVKRILSPHYGMIPASENKRFFQTTIDEMNAEKTIIENGIRQGLSDEEILEKHKERYWSKVRGHNQPYQAYKLNAEITIAMVRKNLQQEGQV